MDLKAAVRAGEIARELTELSGQQDQITKVGPGTRLVVMQFVTMQVVDPATGNGSGGDHIYVKAEALDDAAVSAIRDVIIQSYGKRAAALAAELAVL
jgi:hypothetical protein